MTGPVFQIAYKSATSNFAELISLPSSSPPPHSRLMCVLFCVQEKINYRRVFAYSFDGFSINSIENLTNLGALNSSIYSCCGLGLSHSLIFLCLLFVCVCSLPSSQLLCIGCVCVRDDRMTVCKKLFIAAAIIHLLY